MSDESMTADLQENSRACVSVVCAPYDLKKLDSELVSGGVYFLDARVIRSLEC